MLVSQGTHSYLEPLRYTLIVNISLNSTILNVLFIDIQRFVLKGKPVLWCFKAMLSVFYLDVSDNSRKVGRCHQKECGRRGSVTDRPSPDPGWSSSPSWRPWTSAGEFGSQDSQTGQSIYCLLSFCLVEAKKSCCWWFLCSMSVDKNRVPTVTLRMKHFFFSNVARNCLGLFNHNKTIDFNNLVLKIVILRTEIYKYSNCDGECKDAV